VALILAIAPDLMLGSKIEATLRAAGHEVALTSSVPEDTGDGALVIADLNRVDPASAVALGLPVLGFYAHVDVDAREAALAAGVAQAVPRSRLARELPELVARLLA